MQLVSLSCPSGGSAADQYLTVLAPSLAHFHMNTFKSKLNVT